MLVRFCSWGRGAVIGVAFGTLLACGGGGGSSGTGGTAGASTANGGNAAIETGGQDGSQSSTGGAGDTPGPGTGGVGAAAGRAGTAGVPGGGTGGQPGAAGSKGTAGAKGGGGAGGMGGSQPPNLILNGDAEAALGSTDGMPVATPHWTATGHATAAQYGIDGCPTITDSGPPERGKNVFSGGAKDALSSLSQTVDLSTHGTAIDNGKVKVTLSAYLGGWADQEDNATISATFRDGEGRALGSPIMIGPVTATERNYATSLLPRTKDTAVPAGTRSVDVVITMTRASGDGDNGFADDVSLVLTTSL